MRIGGEARACLPPPRCEAPTSKSAVRSAHLEVRPATGSMARDGGWWLDGMRSPRIDGSVRTEGIWGESSANRSRRKEPGVEKGPGWGCGGEEEMG